MNITEPIRRIARFTPDSTAIIRADHRAIGYGDLERAIDRMAVHAARLGLRAGDIAGLSLSRRDDVLGLILALALARIGVASTDPAQPGKSPRLTFQIVEPGRTAAPGLVEVDAGWIAPGPDEAEVAIHTDPQALFRVFGSSGSTGTPKYIPFTHDLMTKRVCARWLGDGGTRAIRMIGVGIGGGWGFVTLLRTLWAGGTIVQAPGVEQAAAIRRHGVTSIVTSPIALRGLLDAMPEGDPAAYASVRTIELAGSAIPAGLSDLAAARLGARILCGFGSTEAGYIADAPLAVLASRPGAVGYVWPGVRVEAVDADHQPLPAGEAGALRIRGEVVAAGYFGDTAASDERFEDGWFYSGDVGAVWPDGMVTLAGRTSDLINVGGVKISPHLIEDALLTLPTVTDAAAFGVRDELGFEQIWVAIVAPARIDEDVLNEFCQRVLGARAPEAILQMRALPRNENGKLQREQLIELAGHIQWGPDSRGR